MWDGEELGALPSVIGGGLLIGVVGGVHLRPFWLSCAVRVGTYHVYGKHSPGEQVMTRKSSGRRTWLAAGCNWHRLKGSGCVLSVWYCPLRGHPAREP